MDDHRTLDEFSRGRAGTETDENGDSELDHDSGDNSDSELDHGSDENQDSEVDNGSSGEENPDGESPDGEVEPPATTYRWAPDGAACEECGTAVERRWRDGDAFVCEACKEW